MSNKKKIIKRIVVIAVIILLLAVLIYCGDRMLRNPSDRQEGTGDSTQSSQKPQVTIYNVTGKE